jgi:hypothetical protein
VWWSPVLGVAGPMILPRRAGLYVEDQLTGG